MRVSLAVTLLALWLVVAAAASGIELDQSGASVAHCSYYDKGTLPDGRRVWRSIQVDAFPDGTCPARDECFWADVDFDGSVGFLDHARVEECWAAPVEY